jgi:hypothetical protein
LTGILLQDGSTDLEVIFKWKQPRRKPSLVVARAVASPRQSLQKCTSGDAGRDHDVFEMVQWRVAVAANDIGSDRG